MSIRLFYFLVVLAISQSAFAQLSTDSSESTVAVNLYYKSLGNQSPLYNGSEYIETDTILREGHVFFGVNNFEIGTIQFDGMLFRGVPILYDIVRDQVITLHYSQYYKLNLPAEKIDYFSLPGHLFVYLPPDSLNKIRPGFYEKLYDGKTQLLAKRIKKIKEEHSNEDIYDIIVQSTNLYIKKDGVYHIINDKRMLLDVLKNKKKELQQYLKKNNIKFKHNREPAIIRTLEYYDRVTN